MLIDWVTVAAQIINFLVLVYLLRRFLYGPIVAAMRAREQKVGARLAEAERQRVAADAAARDYQRLQADLSQQRDALLADARRAAEAHREALMRAARADVEAVRASWQAGTERERLVFLGALRRRAGAQVLDVSRQVLGDLAGADLEQRVIAVFLERLRHLNEEERAALERALAQPPRTATLRCAFPLEEPQRQQVSRALRDLLGTHVALTSETAPDLICGISLVAGGREIAWSIQSYLDALEEQVAQALAAAPSSRA